MSRAKHSFLIRRRGGRKRVYRVLNVAVALLGLWLLKSEGSSNGGLVSAQAVHGEWVVLEDVPPRVHALLKEYGFLSDGGSSKEYRPGSNQRVHWPEEWSDEEFRILETRSGARVMAEDTVDQAVARITQAIREQRAEVLRTLERDLKEAERLLAVVERNREARASEDVDQREDAERRDAVAKPPSPKAAKPKPKVRREWFTVTAYCPCKKCCGRWSKYHRTASGLPLTYNGGHLVAADTDVLPFHTKVRIPGYAGGRAVPVVDRGSAIKGKMLDVFFPTHWRAKRWGKKRLLVEIIDE